jgi:DNA-binding MarR family transcriptional regulator
MTQASGTTVKTGMLDDLLGYHLRRAQSAVFAEFMQSMSSDQVTPGQFGVLVLINENAGLNQSALAKALGIERSTMVGVIDVLEKRDLVERRKSKTDKRAHALTLTVTGKQVLKSVKPKVRQHENRVADDLSAEETETLMGLLKRVAR